MLYEVITSGKTTLTRKVVALLKAKGYKVAVIKSTKETGIIVDQPGTDTDLYKKSGADAIALLAPDQLIIQRKPVTMELVQLSQMLFVITSYSIHYTKLYDELTTESPGSYDVTLIATSAMSGCSETLTKENYLEVVPSPNAEFDVDP